MVTYIAAIASFVIMIFMLWRLDLSMQRQEPLSTMRLHLKLFFGAVLVSSVSLGVYYAVPLLVDGVIVWHRGSGIGAPEVPVYRYRDFADIESVVEAIRASVDGVDSVCPLGRSGWCFTIAATLIAAQEQLTLGMEREEIAAWLHRWEPLYDSTPVSTSRRTFYWRNQWHVTLIETEPGRTLFWLPEPARGR